MKLFMKGQTLDSDELERMMESGEGTLGGERLNKDDEPSPFSIQGAVAIMKRYNERALAASKKALGNLKK
jgi:hypothetical protein